MFVGFFLSNFDSKYSLLEVHIADDGCGKNSVQTELQHPLKVALTFGKTHVKFIVSDTVIYSKLQLSGGSIRLLQGISEDCFYVCGAQLPLTLTSDEQLPVVREGINCNSLVEFAYYSSKKFKNVCAYCGSDDCTIDQAFKEQFQTVLPICRECCASGSKPITRGMFRKRPNKVAEPNSRKQPRLQN